MPADPFSIAGAVGLAAGLLGFLVSTLEKTAGVVDNTRYYTEHFQRNVEYVRSCQRRLEAWTAKWYSASFESDIRAHAQHLWGPAGLQEIQTLLEHIDWESAKIQRCLCNCRDMRSNDQQHWSLLLRSRPLYHEEPPQEVTRLVHVVANVLWRNGLVKESITHLRFLVEELKWRSDFWYNKARGATNLEQSVAHDDITTLKVIQERVQQLWRLMRTAHERFGDQVATYAFLLTHADDNHQSLLIEHQEQLQIDFLHVANAYGTDEPCQKAPIPYHWELDTHLDVAKQMNLASRQAWGQELAGTLGEAFKIIFWMIVDSSVEQQKTFRYGCKHACAQAAVSIATWATLLWNSRWMDDLCSCAIRNATFANTDKTATFQQPRTHLMTGCSNLDPGRHQYLQLALVLCELALACPISVHLDDDNRTCFRMNASDLDPEILDQAAILIKVHRATSRFFRDAVRFCLTCDQELPEGRYAGSDIVLQNRARIVLPLQQHYDTLAQHRNRHDRIWSPAERILQSNITDYSRPDNT